MLNNQTEMDILIQRYIKHLRNSVSDKTKQDYTIDLEVFQRYIEKKGLKITDVTIEHLENYAEYLQNIKQYAESTQSRKLQVVKYFFEYLIEIKYITENPSITLKLPKIPKREPVFLELKEAQKLIKIINKEKNKYLRIRDRAMFLILINNGLRVSELANIKISDIKGKKLTVIGKGNKERSMNLTDDTLEAINDYLKIRPNVDTDIIFLSNRKKPIGIRTIQATGDKYFDKMNLEGYSIHKMRHTAASLMSDQGIETSDIQEILGHESIVTTKIYTHTTEKKKEMIAQKMNGLLTQ